MNILVVCSSPEEFNTSSMLCLRLICEGLMKLNHKIVFLTPEPDENSRYFVPNYSFEHENLTHLRFGTRIKKTSKVHQGKKGIKASVMNILLKTYRRFDLFGKSIETLKYIDEIKQKLIVSGFEPDVLLSASDPKVSHILARKLLAAFLKRPYFLQYWGDPLTLDIAKKTLTPRFVRKCIEKNILEPADKVVYVSPLTLTEQQNFFPKLKEKMSYQPTPCESIAYEGTEEKYIGYFGSYNSSVRDIKPLYDAVNKNGQFKLIIIGDSDVALEETEHVKIIDRIPAEELVQYYNKCSVIANLTNDFGAQIPAKIFRDAGTNKEILLIYNEKTGQAVKEYFSQYNRYTLCPNTCEDINAALNDYCKNGIPDRIPLAEFNYVNVAKELIENIS